jgi:hypothetical protein
VRRATKWGKTGKNAQWCETWMEDYGSDGRTDKTAYKWATLAASTTLDNDAVIRSVGCVDKPR